MSHLHGTNKKEGEASRVVLAGCYLLLAVLGWLDYVTGYEMSFFVFYSVPVGLAAWFVGRWAAICLAVAATTTWLAADYFSGAKYTAPFFYYWNSTIHFLAFIINAVTIAKIKRDLDRRHALAAELEAAQAKLRAVAALPFCPACGKRREGTAASNVPDMPTISRSGFELNAAVCAECREASSFQAAGSP